MLNDELKMDLQLFAEEEQDNDENTGSQDASAEDVKTDDGNNESGEDVVPYKRFKEVIDEKNELQNKLNSLQGKIENMEDPEKIKEEFKQENEKLKQRNTNFLKQSELKVAALKNGVREDAVEDLIKIAELDNLEVEDGQVEGLNELLEDMKENKAYLFDSTGAKLKGRTPNKSNNDNDDKNANNPFKKGQVNLTERARLIKEEPEKAKRLIKAAGKKLERFNL